jgi:predicted secreted protein
LKDEVDRLPKDERSGRIAVVAHCILNQNSRVLGLAERTSVITEIAEFLMCNDIGIIQMPCPELSYAGILRKRKTKDEYDTATFRSHCRRIAKEITHQIEEYAKYGINAEIVIGVDGSPSCGVNETSKRNPREEPSNHERVKGSGILIEELHTAMKEREISIPFHGIRYERLPEDLGRMEELVKD